MKNMLPILFLLHFLMGCNDQKSTRQETVTRYYNAFDSANYQEIRTLINDSITIISGDYVTPYSGESFHEFFKWDSIFKPSYKIVELEEKNNRLIATIASKSLRYEFLKNNPLICQFEISFNHNKISKIRDVQCIGTDWNIWQKQRDSLVRWINKNHPKLDGFIYDMTMAGAINYVKAIELYETEKTPCKD